MPTSLPIDIPTSQQFDGNDGKWSSFIVRVGTPEQSFRVFPAPGTGEVLIPLPQGCNEYDPPDCGARRGVYGYKNSTTGFSVGKSSTWKELGLYSVGLKSELGYAANASYGLDNVGLMIPNAGGPTLKNQVVGGIASSTFYLGIFGLSPRASNFSEFAYPQRSFITTLKDENMVPSISYSYTAGAFYKSPPVPASLVLGGFDQSRIKPPLANITFPFDFNDSRPLCLNIQRISASNTTMGSVSLMDEEIYGQIDFTVPHLWLPRHTCDRFETAFGLTYDNSTDLYRISDERREEMLAKNPAVTIGFGSTSNPAERVNIVLPYSSFDLEASHPIYPNKTYYFPIRRAANESQYILGRTLLQEAYVVVDYERKNFSIHQARFPKSNEPKQIITITDPRDVGSPNGTTISNTPNQKLTKNAIIGISIGGAAFLVMLIALVILLYRRRCRTIAAQMDKPDGSPSPTSSSQTTGMEEVTHIPQELQGPETRELGGRGITEMAGVLPEHQLTAEERRLVHELPAGRSRSPSHSRR